MMEFWGNGGTDPRKPLIYKAFRRSPGGERPAARGNGSLYQYAYAFGRDTVDPLGADNLLVPVRLWDLPV